MGSRKKNEGRGGGGASQSWTGTGSRGQRLGDGRSGTTHRDWRRGLMVVVVAVVAALVVGLYYGDEVVGRQKRAEGGSWLNYHNSYGAIWTRWTSAIRSYFLDVEPFVRKGAAKVVEYTFELPLEHRLKVYAFGKGSSSLSATTLHPINAASEDERGEPVLVIHGSDGLMPVQQAVISTKHLLSNVTSTYLVIGVARPGYQSVPIKAGVKQPTEQADLYATLLEELSIPSAVVISYGTGIQSAVAFASKYPGMCRLLVAVDAIETPPSSLLSHGFYTYFISTISSKYELWRGVYAGERAQEDIAKELISNVARRYLFANDDLGQVNDVNTLVGDLLLNPTYKTPTLVLNGCNAVPQVLTGRSDTIEVITMEDAICSYANGIVINPISARKTLGQFTRKHTPSLLVF